MSQLVADIAHEFRRHKALADRAMAELTDAMFFQRPAEQVNPVALIVKHLAGNLSSRWSDFLTSDGDKPSRDRDSEFVLRAEDTRSQLLGNWEASWAILFATLAQLADTDLSKVVPIRGEPHRVQQALLRGLDHAAYHIGQILYVSRWLNPGATWLTIAPGQSQAHPGRYLKSP